MSPLQLMSEPYVSDDVLQALNLGRMLGQRRAFAAMGGRCSAAHAQLLRRIHNEKLYLSIAPSWQTFCGTHLALSRRHADRLIALLDRFGPAYFELSQLVGLSPKQFAAIQPAVSESGLTLNGETISLIPDNSPKLLAAVGELLHQPHPRKPRARSTETVHTRVVQLADAARDIINQLTALYNDSRSPRDREFIQETATALRILLMLGLD